MTASGTGPWVFIDDLTANGWSRMNSEVFRGVLSAEIQPNIVQLLGWHFKVQVDIQDCLKAKKFKILQ